MSVRGAGRLYVGHVMHMRLIPRRHRFRYRVFSILVDIDRLDALPVRLLGHNRRALLTIRDRDHGARDGSPLRPWVDRQLARAGRPAAERVDLLCFPRLWGYVFNPLSVYFCYAGSGELQSVIYEVKNTFGEQVAYTRPAGGAEHGLHRHDQPKEMYVSPFIGMDQVYRFDVAPPGDRLSLRIRQAGPEGETLIATQTGRARPLTDRALLGAVLTHPLMTLKVMAAIHWQALRLVLKGVRLAPAPDAEGAR